jgi:hypothetical protein
LDEPIATACLRLLMLCFPERMWCISVRTSWLARRRLLLLERLRDVAFFCAMLQIVAVRGTE